MVTAWTKTTCGRHSKAVNWRGGGREYQSFLWGSSGSGGQKAKSTNGGGEARGGSGEEHTNKLNKVMMVLAGSRVRGGGEG